jgi:hypothetical protein
MIKNALHGSRRQASVAGRFKATFAGSALLVIASSLYLYCFAFFPLFVPVFPGQSDCDIYLSHAQRMLDGQLIYRDFFEFLTPGATLVDLLFIKLFGLRPWIPNVLILILGVGFVWVGVAISRKLMKPGIVWLPSALFLVDVRYYLSDPGHHWYSSLAVMAGIASLIQRRTPVRIAAAGCFCGLSSCFTQTKGLFAVVGFAVFLLWDCRQRQTGRREFFRNLAWLAAGFAAILLLVNGYFIVKAGPARFFWCTIVYVLKYYPHQADWNSSLVFAKSLQGGGAAAYSFRLYENIAKSFIDVAAGPCICLLVLVRYLWRVRTNSWDDWDRPVLVAVVGLFLFLSMSPAPSPPRLVPGSLPGFVLVGWLLDSRSNVARSLSALCSVAVLAVASYSVIHSRPKEIGVLTTAQGNTGFSEDGENVFPEYQWVQRHTHPGEFFFRAGFPDINFYLDLRNPTPLPRITNNGYTTIAQVNDAIDGLERHQTRYIAWNTSYLDSIPQWENPSDAHLQPLRDYIRTHYEPVQFFEDSGEVIWERKTE